MKKNMGSADKTIRVFIAAVVALLYFTGFITGITGNSSDDFSACLCITSLISFCPLYPLLGINTRKKE